ncbi:MAG: N-acetylmuramoyl-L-alanine amidase [Parcubacteria group bacterium Athens0714_25]|nr:MAG: N-acetylmuramoyl-L-alanine amidase [Parcubacteria group bacterium Athens0714_25]
MTIKNTKYIYILFAILIVILAVSFWFFFSGREKGELVIENLSEAESFNANIQTKEVMKVGGIKNADVGDATSGAVEVAGGKIKEEDAPVTSENKSAENGADAEIKKEEVKDSDLKIFQNLVSWGYAKKSSRNIDTIIIHSSYDALGSEPYNVRGLIDEYKQYGVAPHYLIDREGSVYRLVEDKNIAYHAGQSQVPDGRTGVNDFSLGIELMNTKKEKYTAEQYVALSGLLDYLKGEYEIKYVDVYFRNQN